MNEHESMREKLALAAAGSLDLEEMREVQRHASACDACRRELERWSIYTQGLRRLPQPAIPAGLLERTQARILQQHAVTAGRASYGLILGGLAGFGWATSIAFWILADIVADGVLNQTASVFNPVAWSLATTLLVWITAGTAAVALTHRRFVRRVL
jgi:hypothetical protein